MLSWLVQVPICVNLVALGRNVVAEFRQPAFAQWCVLLSVRVVLSRVRRLVWCCCFVSAPCALLSRFCAFAVPVACTCAASCSFIAAGCSFSVRDCRYQIHQGGVVALAFIAATNPASFMLLKSGVFGSQLVSAPVSKRFEVGL